MRCLVLLALLTAPAFAQSTLPASPDPQSKSAVSDDASPNATSQPDANSQPTKDSKDYSNESSLVEKYEVRVTFENEGTGHREETARIRVQSDAGVKRWGQLIFGYNSANERMDIPYVRVVKKDGSVVTAGADAVQELNPPIQRVAPVYTDFREKHVTVPGLRAGDILEWQTVVVVHTPYAPGQFWAQRNFSKNIIALDEELEIDVPAARTIKVKSKPGYDPKVTEENGRRIYRWSTSNLEVASPKKDADKKTKKKKSEDDAADVQLSSFSTWEEVGRWYAGLEKERRVPTAAIKTKAGELTKGRTSDLAKIEALYDYTALNSRYVSLSLGIGRYQPQPAEDVLKNQYGDCKDKNTLLAALLEASGYHSSTVLIGTQHKLDPDIPSPAQFNHVITMVPTGTEEVWMDTTTEVAPFRLLSYPIRKKQGLVIPQNGTPHLEETPADSPVADSESVLVEGKIDDAGKLDAKVSYEIRGDSEVPMRLGLRAVSNSQWQQVMEGLSSKEGLGSEISEVKISDLTATREPFSYSFHVMKANYLDVSKKKSELKLPAGTVGMANASSDDADSPDPVKLGPVNTFHYKLKLEFPSRYTIHAPVPISVKRDYANYEVTYKVDGTVLAAERTFTVAKSEIASSSVDEYLAFRRAVLEDVAQKISLENENASAAATPSSEKPADLFKQGSEAAKQGDDVRAIQLFKRGVEADPKTKNGWNELGIAYLNSWQDDLALAAFQKQIEVAPYHQYAFENIGRIYLRERKYEEAIKWSNKQIDIDPLNKQAHRNIGIALLEQHKYAEALPVLEKSASLDPENVDVQVRLGQAYLGIDQDDKAMAAFDRAVKISAKPGTWNIVAYRLAEKKAHLDIARSYAESAVSSTTASLRVLSLDVLNTHDLGSTASLASFWDTQGWVAFAEGKLDEAGKYLTASWQLSPRAEVGDHLGQLFEKQGDSVKAAHLYALAMNAKRPEPETRNRLATLMGGDSKADAMIAASSEEFAKQGTIHMANSLKLDGEGDFLVLLKNGTNSGVAVDSIRFVSGQEKLKPMGDALQAAHFEQSLPNGTPVKLLRRGTLSCAANAECTFRMIPPDDVRTVN